MKLRKNKKPSFAPRKQKPSLIEIMNNIISIVTIVDWTIKIIKYILSLFE